MRRMRFISVGVVLLGAALGLAACGEPAGSRAVGGQAEGPVASQAAGTSSRAAAASRLLDGDAAADTLARRNRHLGIRVVGTDGRFMNAEVAVLQGAALLGVERAWAVDNGSRCTADFALPDGGGVGDIYVVSATTVHREVGFALAPGVRYVVVPDGAVVTGRVDLINGRAEHPPTIEVITDRDDPGWAALPRAVQAAIRRDDWWPLTRSFEVGADGAFNLTGFSHGWRGRIAVRPIENYELVDATGLPGPIEHPACSAPLAAPASGIALTARGFPIISGRLVGPSTAGMSVDRVRLDYTVVTRAGDVLAFYDVCDVGARFETPLRTSAAARVSIVCVGIPSPPGTATRTIDILQGLDRDIDLGDVELVERRITRTFVVSGQAGPIAGALVASVRPPEAISDPTDAKGLTTLELPAGDPSVRVGAVGYAVREIDLPTDIAQPVAVLLTRTNMLEIRLAEARGGMTRLDLFANRALFASERGWQDPLHLAAGATRARPLAVSPEQLARGVSMPSAWHTAVLTGVQPGVPFAIDWSESHGGGGRLENLVLGADEWRTLDLPVQDPRPESRVADVLGPLAQALGIGTPDVDNRVPGGSTLIVNVVTADGAPFERPIGGMGDHAPVWLEGARGARFWYDSPGSDESSMGAGPVSDLGVARYEFGGLPAGELTAKVEGTAGEIWESRVKSGQGTAQVVVPSHGRVYVAWGFALPHRVLSLPFAQRCAIRFEPLTAGLPAMTVAVDSSASYHGVLVVPNVRCGRYSVWMECPRATGDAERRSQVAVVDIVATASATVTLMR